MKEETYRHKQEWLDNVMASNLSHATKTFAYCIFKRMYGTKVTSYPMTDDILADGGFASSGHFTEYRRALVNCGALAAELDYHTARATNKNYEYTLRLDWDGAVAHTGERRSTSGKSHSTYGGSHSTAGASNTTNNTPTNTTSNTTTDVPSSASAPDVTFCKIDLEEEFTYEVKDMFSSSNHEFEPALYKVDLTGVAKETAVPPVEVQQAGPVDRDSTRAAQDWVDALWN